MSRPVVYIDDEPSLCRVFEMVLRARGTSIATFIDAAEAVTYLNAHEAAVVFCDFRMPKMSGLEVLAQLRREVPFYLVSGALEAAGCAGAPGVTGVLAKPFCAEELISIVARYAT